MPAQAGRGAAAESTAKVGGAPQACPPTQEPAGARLGTLWEGLASTIPSRSDLCVAKTEPPAPVCRSVVPGFSGPGPPGAQHTAYQGSCPVCPFPQGQARLGGRLCTKHDRRTRKASSLPRLVGALVGALSTPDLSSVTLGLAMLPPEPTGRRAAMHRRGCAETPLGKDGREVHPQHRVPSQTPTLWYQVHGGGPLYIGRLVL